MATKLQARFLSPIHMKPDDSNLHQSRAGKDSYHWSFGKARRFHERKLTIDPEFITPPTSLANRATSFGLGRRWEPKNDKGKDSPPPTTYNPPTLFSNNSKTMSFGNGSTAERIPIRLQLTPGPGSYNPSSPIGGGSPKFSFRPRIHLKTKISAPAPSLYSPNFKLIEKSNFSKIGFGYGQRLKIGSRDSSPGPGSYEVLGGFSTTQSRFITPIRNQTPIQQHKRLKSALDH